MTTAQAVINRMEGVSVQAVIDRMEGVSFGRVRKKLILTVTLGLCAALLFAADLWVIASGMITERPAKTLAALVALAAVALLIVVVIAFLSLVVSMLTYQRFRYIKEEEARLEAERRCLDLLGGVGHALHALSPASRGTFLDALKTAPQLGLSRPGMTEELEELERDAMTEVA